jgi:hypothetical protein
MHKILAQFDRPAAEPEPEIPIATEEASTACEELAPFRNPEESDPAVESAPPDLPPPPPDGGPGHRSSGPRERVEAGPTTPESIPTVENAGHRHDPGPSSRRRGIPRE